MHPFSAGPTRVSQAGAIGAISIRYLRRGTETLAACVLGAGLTIVTATGSSKRQRP